ncbi:MAG: phenylalanine--tRNA ligase subunit beta, partial [Verrucomicrobia bacterium]|nr:phenylalanine--tRNA ligase subunit beta [Verrucomicrobiota bacterium]
MKITLNWLRQYVDFTGSAEELAERLTMLGLEVEGIERSAGEFENIVVGQVITRETHPNADRLSYCRVNDGKGERMIVCGATNFKAGDKIPLALPGAVMPTDPGEPAFIIKVGKIRGCESQGMMCSGKELRLTTDADGLLILPADASVGQPFAEHLGRATADVILDLEITPNRPDLNSLIGVAREIAAITGKPLKLPVVSIPAEATASSPKPPVSIQIEDPILCPRYVGRVLMGVKVGPSPDWLKQSLAKVGIRSINNVVDVTNYVMLETGQPLHAFDLHLLATNPQGLSQIVVRRAREGEEFITLDGLSRKLSTQALLIADPEKAIALAGIMGGQNTEIRPTTTDILIESACFKAESVRATSKALGLKTDASYRFERGADVGICAWANERAAQLILQLGGGKAAGENVDAWPSQAPRKSIALRHHRVREILGVDVTAEEQRRFLEGLEIRSTSTTSGETTYEIPSFRVDLKREHDLVEEIGRLYGIDKIPSTPPRGCVGDHAFDAVHDDLAEARTHFTSLGFNEAQGQTLISEAAAALLSPAEQITRLAYPLSSDMNVLRPSLIPGLLDSLKHNLSRQTHDVAL